MKPHAVAVSRSGREGERSAHPRAARARGHDRTRRPPDANAARLLGRAVGPHESRAERHRCQLGEDHADAGPGQARRRLLHQQPRGDKPVVRAVARGAVHVGVRGEPQQQRSRQLMAARPAGSRHKGGNDGGGDRPAQQKPTQTAPPRGSDGDDTDHGPFPVAVRPAPEGHERRPIAPLWEALQLGGRQWRRGGVHERRRAVVDLNGRRPTREGRERPSLHQELDQGQVTGVCAGRGRHHGEVRRGAAGDGERTGAVVARLLPTRERDDGDRHRCSERCAPHRPARRYFPVHGIRSPLASNRCR